jgi:hypothetical protein
MMGNNMTMPPQDPFLFAQLQGLKGKPLPYVIADFFSSWPSFTSTMYCSLDYQLVILYILVFSLFDRVTGSSVVAVFIVYVVEKILWKMRGIMGENNLSKKTLIDERFLI